MLQVGGGGGGGGGEEEFERHVFVSTLHSDNKYALPINSIDLRL
jgi:hypothetical protein